MIVLFLFLDNPIPRLNQQMGGDQSYFGRCLSCNSTPKDISKRCEEHSKRLYHEWQGIANGINLELNLCVTK